MLKLKRVILSILYFSFLVISCESYSQSSNINYSKLTAVLVVGPQEDGTHGAINEMKRVESFLESKGVTVKTYYGKKAKWDEIIKGAKGVNFFIYSGHGTTTGENESFGGLCVDKIVSVSTMQRELKLAKNSMVLFQSVCGGTGSSAGDFKDIGVKEAYQRVSDYSNSFFKIGASVYYANNYQDGCLKFLKVFFNNTSLGDSYKLTASTFTKIEGTRTLKEDADKSISIASTKGEGYATYTKYVNGVKTVKKVKAVKAYDVAFVGNKNFTISDLIKNK